MIRKLFLTSATAVMMMALNAAAHADTVTLVSRAGTGVTAQISNYTLTGSQFTFTIINTSVAPGPTGTITSIGFDLTGTNRGTFELVSASDADFRLKSSTSGNATGLNTTFDFALVTGPNFNGGKPNEGIAPGGSGTFTVMGNFSGLTEQQIAESIFARFQRVNGEDSDVAGFPGGTPPPPQPIPEPATMLLLGTGLAGTVARIRKRRRAEKNSADQI